MTHDLTRTRIFEYESTNALLGDIIIIGEDRKPYSTTTHSLKVQPHGRCIGNPAHTKQVEAIQEAIQSRKISDLYEHATALTIHPDDEGQTAQMATKNLREAQKQADELEGVAIYQTIVRLLEYLSLTPRSNPANESNRIIDPETVLRFLGQSPQGRELGENLPPWERYTYQIAWSEDHKEFVGTCDRFPLISCSAPTPVQAFSGIRNLADQAFKDEQAEKAVPDSRHCP